MSRTIPAALLATYQAEVSSVAHALKVVRPDGTIYAFTSADKDAIIDGVQYKADPGLDIASIESAASTAVGNLELRTLHDGSVFTTLDVLGGLWKNSAFTLFRYDFNAVAASSPTGSTEIDVLMAGTFGDVTLKAREVVAELRDLRQYLQNAVGVASSKTCRYRVGSSDEYDGGLCTVDLGGSIGGVALTRSGTVTSVTSGQVFSDSTCTEPNDWFGAGELEWTSGANVGQKRVIKAFSGGSPDNGTFTLYLPMYAAILPGDTYTVTAGCRKRLEEDCLAKFNNVLNFGGEPHRPSVDEITKPPVIDA